MSTILPAIQALGTTWYIEVFDELDEEAKDGAFGAVLCFLNTFNDSYSRFRSDSLISRLNQERQLEHPSDELITLLSLGQQWYQKTSGVFNMLLEEELVRRGYDKDYSFRERVGTDIVFADPTKDLVVTPSCITLKRGRVDLGGFGKGYAIDRVAHLLLSLGVDYFLINGGGDMYATSDNDNPITIYLEHPTKNNIFLGETTLHHEAFAASSPHKRQWRTTAGTVLHHLVTTTEQPIADAVFVKATSAVEADILATTSAIDDTVIAGDGYAIARYNTTTNTFSSSPTFSPLTLF